MNYSCDFVTEWNIQTNLLCDYFTVKPNDVHGQPAHNLRGYLICQNCYESILEAERGWEETQNRYYRERFMKECGLAPEPVQMELFE